MAHTEALAAAFDAYLDEVDEVMRRKKPGDGIFGAANGPQHHPCHARFDQLVGELTAQLSASSLSAEAAADIVGFLLHDESLDRGVDCARWMLLAVQRHCLPLIPRLSPDDAHSLCTWYEERYPRSMRFPAQEDIIKALRKQCRGR